MRSSLQRKLARWEEAGLIDAATRTRIETFEHADRKPIATYALGVLGAGTVALGIVSIIAANWDAIPGGVKLATDLALGAALAAATYASVERGRGWLTEVLVTVFYGFTLASLALVGQVYQLGTPVYQALLVWSLTTLPLVLVGRSRTLGVLVTAGLATTHVASLEGLFDALELRRADERNLLATLAFVSPLVYVPLSRLAWLTRERPEYARVLGEAAWVAVLVGGFALQFVWYERLDAGDTLSWALAATGLAVALLAAALPKLYPELAATPHRTLAILLGYAWLGLALGTSFTRGSVDFVGALLQVGWLGLFAWLALQLGLARLFHALTGLVGLRVIAIYFEVFGSMLDTGVGLVTGGLLTLVVAWLWRRKTRDLTAKLRAPVEGTDAA